MAMDVISELRSVKDKLAELLSNPDPDNPAWVNEIEGCSEELTNQAELLGTEESDEDVVFPTITEIVTSLAGFAGESQVVFVDEDENSYIIKEVAEHKTSKGTFVEVGITLTESSLLRETYNG